jgi:ornithine cyclodeaminase/alanine dehydrogenase-like protein (mu-crystallin family)
LPTIQGVVGLFDGTDGRVLALMDSTEITAYRTAAMSAVAGMHLARPHSRAIAIIGCGVQGRYHLRSFKRAMALPTAIVFDRMPGAAAAFAHDLARDLDIDIRIAKSAGDAAAAADICVTCTTAREPVLFRGDVRPGTFVAAVGADNPDKQEMDPDLMAASTVVVDLLDQCAASGDLHHAIAAGAMRKTDVHGELAEIVAGIKPGRRSDSEIAIFDSSGTALQDVAVAVVAYEGAQASGLGRWLSL